MSYNRTLSHKFDNIIVPSVHMAKSRAISYQQSSSFMTYREATQIIHGHIMLQEQYRDVQMTEDVRNACKLLLKDHVYFLFWPVIKWKQNSCYFSTLMVAMFLQPCETITNKILLCDDTSKTDDGAQSRQKLTDEINDLVLKMRIFHPPANNINKIRHAFQQTNIGRNLNLTGTESPTEVLLPLIKLYGMEEYIKVVITSYKNNNFNKYDFRREQLLATNPHILIETSDIEEYMYANNHTTVIDVSRAGNLTHTTEAITTENGRQIQTTAITETTYLNTKIKFMVLELKHKSTIEHDRSTDFNFVNLTFIASPRLALFPHLTLTTVICILSGHYTCIYFNRDDRNWYNFNDISNEGRPTLIDENAKDKKIREQGYLFFYQEN